MQSFKNVLFVPHGAPTFALNPGAAGAAMTDITQKLSPPRAIVVLSPHWDTHVPTVGVSTQLETIHDFYCNFQFWVRNVYRIMIWRVLYHFCKFCFSRNNIFHFPSASKQ